MKNSHGVSKLFLTIAFISFSNNKANSATTNVPKNQVPTPPPTQPNAIVTTPAPANVIPLNEKISFIQSRNSIYDHVSWGNIISRLRNVDEYNPYVYFGFGNCPKNEQLFSVLRSAPNTKQIVKFYSNLLGLSCKPQTEEKILALFTKKFLRLDFDHTLLLNFESGAFEDDNPRLNKKDTVMLAFHLHALSQIHVSLNNFPVTPNTPDGEPMTDDAFVTLNIILAMLDAARDKFPTDQIVLMFLKEYANEVKNLLPNIEKRALTVFSFRRFSAFAKLRIFNSMVVLFILEEFCRKKSTPNAKDPTNLQDWTADAHDIFQDYYLNRKPVFVKELTEHYSWIKLPIQ